jgi:DNA-binding NarL/FixJ family response regulator
VDDHKILSEGLRRIIDESGIAAVSTVYNDLDSARKGLADARPDVLLLDVELPDGNGVDFCAELIKQYPDLKIMMLTSFDNISIAKRSLKNGARGYSLKNAMPEEIISGIEAVNNGEQFLCEEIDLLLKQKKEEQILYLSPREKELLKLIADGYTDNEIADRLFLSKESSKTYRKNLLMKFNAKNSIMLVKIAQEEKLI